jgi:hypothetical protein
VHEVERRITRASITAEFSISLAGMMCPPMPIYIYIYIYTHTHTHTHKMFEVIVGNQLVTELKRVEVKIRQIQP